MFTLIRRRFGFSRQAELQASPRAGAQAHTGGNHPANPEHADATSSTRLLRAVRSSLHADNIGYDRFYKTTIRNIPLSKVPPLVRDAFSEFDEDHSRSHALLDAVGALGRSYLVLLADPLIAHRGERFVEFAKGHLALRPGTSPLALRAAFIRSFKAQVFFRALFLRKGEVLDKSRLAGDFAKAVRDPIKGTEFFAYVTEALGHHGDAGLPIIGTFREKAYYHRRDTWTGHSFFSVSGRPEVAWYVVADNGKKRWQQWKEGDRLAICRFEMNSFYAIPWIEMFPRMKSHAELDLGAAGKIPVDDPSVEYLVPIALPENWHASPRVFAPTFGPNGEPVRFDVATAQAWERPPRRRPG